MNVSAITIPLTPGIYATMKEKSHFRSIEKEEIDKHVMFACGLSLVIHPINPHVPTTHCNYRILVVYDKETKEVKDWWFGGGCDLTPIYLHAPSAIHFHNVIKAAMDKFDKDAYPKFKKICDDYFCIEYRKERRGVGGSFMENIRDKPYRELFEFMKAQGNSFVPSYVPIVEARKDLAYTDEEVEFRKWRRSRYAEFNLVYDRGTKFGLHTPDAHIENILMSLPLTCSWKFKYEC